MNSELNHLIRLQQLDSRILELEGRIQQIPEKKKGLESALEEERRSVEDLQHRIEETNQQRRLLEGDTEALQEQLSRYKTQLMEVKTNKEYQAMLHEIETTKQKIDAKENEVLEMMMSLDEWEASVKDARQRFKKCEQELAARRAELEQFESGARSEIDQLNREREQIQEHVSPELIDQYHRIALARNGMALAEARDQSCQACHVKLRPQLFAEIRTNRQIVTCESCNRILYYAET